MSHAAKVITEELAYLRALHADALAAGKTIIANSVGCDIADLVQALDVIERREAEDRLPPPAQAGLVLVCDESWRRP